MVSPSVPTTSSLYANMGKISGKTCPSKRNVECQPGKNHYGAFERSKTMSTQSKISRKTILDIKKMKTQGEKIAMLTAYDFGMASILDESEIDIILVGDSLGNGGFGL